MIEDNRDYRKDFALAVLRRAFRPMTASEIAEHIAVLGPVEGHPRKCWAACSPVVIAGVMRTLELNNVVTKDEEPVKNTRSGRLEPKWIPVDGYDRAAAIPMAPDLSEQAPAPATAVLEAKQVAPAAVPAVTSPYADLSRQQLYALLQVHDEISGAAARFFSEVRDINSRARAALMAVGIEVPQE